MRAITWARSSARWLRDIARHYHVPATLLARQLRTGRALAWEVAQLLNEVAEAEARQLVWDDKRAPADRDFYSELVRRHYAPLWDAKKKAARANAREVLSAEVKEARQHKKAEGK